MWYQLPVHIGLTLAWAALWGSFSPGHLIVGAIVGCALIHAFARGARQPFYLRRILALERFLRLFLWHVFLANLQVAHICISPELKIRPGIVALPLRVQTDGAIAALTHMLTVTPGSVPLDISPDKKEIYIHCPDLGRLDSVIHSKDVFEELLLEVTA